MPTESMWKLIPAWIHQPRKGQKWQQYDKKRTYVIVGRARGPYREKFVLYKNTFGITVRAMDVGDFMEQFTKVKEGKS